MPDDTLRIVIPLPPEVLRVLDVIRACGGHPMLVGGCVRDAVMRPGSRPKDIDLEVYGPVDVERLEYALAEARCVVREAGKAFSVLLVRAGDTDLDVSLPRRDSKTGDGHRGFTVTPDSTLGYAEASARRDFTIGSLMADPATGLLIDCHGGLADLHAGVLRHTSKAFPEDPLRVLRAFSFAARFGFRVAPETTALCRTLTGQASSLPIRRVWGQFEQIGTQGTHISAALRVLAETGWDRHFPQLAALHGVEQDQIWHPEGDVWAHSGLAADQAARLADEAGLTGEDRLVVVMAALAHDFGKVARTDHAGPWWRLARIVLRGRRWRITNHGHAEAGVEPAQAFFQSIGCPERITRRILPLIAEHMNCLGPPTTSAVNRLARRLAPATMAEYAIVVGADHAGRGDPAAANPAAAWLKVAEALSVEVRPARGLLTGDHLIEAGLIPGPAFKPLLAAAIAAQDAGDFDDDAGARRWLADQLART
jgi:tRNA nucleotidyltransferase (CCA-adding enzyme)